MRERIDVDGEKKGRRSRRGRAVETLGKEEKTQVPISCTFMFPSFYPSGPIFKASTT